MSARVARVRLGADGSPGPGWRTEPLDPALHHAPEHARVAPRAAHALAHAVDLVRAAPRAHGGIVPPGDRWRARPFRAKCGRDVPGRRSDGPPSRRAWQPSRHRALVRENARLRRALQVSGGSWRPAGRRGARARAARARPVAAQPALPRPGGEAARPGLRTLPDRARQGRAARYGLPLVRGPGLVRGRALLLWSDISNDRIMRWDEETGAVSVFRKPSHKRQRQHGRGGSSPASPSGPRSRATSVQDLTPRTLEPSNTKRNEPGQDSRDGFSGG